MLSDIVHFWPPPFGQPEVGNKTVHADKSHIHDTLVGLHEHAWWTGIRVGLYPLQNVPIEVRLSMRNGSTMMAEEFMTWIQSEGTWTPFPFPIPAKMATTLQIDISVRVVGSANQHMSVCMSFQELPHLIENDRYLFVSDNDTVLLYWNGARRAWGNPAEGAEPTWRTIHRVVPTMRRLLSNSPYQDTFCIHRWDQLLTDTC
jgi:hypothetical protein